MDFKRALVEPQKGIFCKPIGRLFEAKRASFKIEGVKNNYKSKAKTTKSPLPNGKGYDYCDIPIKKIEKRESTF
ncbi:MULTISPECIES: hypothetical protein [unclassified Prevotella]|uniref:hypothetical protein n=1 Tax=Prevotella sp. ICM33 TaxID=1161412 RepID=UPI000563EC80|nr:MULTISPECIES: hypothetical protein [unclassified Prevotella]